MAQTWTQQQFPYDSLVLLILGAWMPSTAFQTLILNWFGGLGAQQSWAQATSWDIAGHPIPRVSLWWAVGSTFWDIFLVAFVGHCWQFVVVVFFSFFFRLTKGQELFKKPFPCNSLVFLIITGSYKQTVLGTIFGKFWWQNNEKLAGNCPKTGILIIPLCSYPFLSQSVLFLQESMFSDR